MSELHSRPSRWSLLFLFLSSVSGRLRRALWRWWYDQLARRDRHNELVFMNYGYCGAEPEPVLSPEEENNRYPIQLYRHVIEGLDLEGRRVAEVGSGRGGGAAYLARHYRPEVYTGIDLSAEAIDWCNRHHQQDCLQWRQGSADSLPLADAACDLVINVESSHCYPSMPAFLREVHRVLKPGGWFAFCDLRSPKGMAELQRQFVDAGFEILRSRQINREVLAALDRMSAQRAQRIHSQVHKTFRKLFSDFAALKGTRLYEMLEQHSMLYYSFQCRKPAQFTSVHTADDHG